MFYFFFIHHKWMPGESEPKDQNKRKSFCCFTFNLFWLKNKLNKQKKSKIKLQGRFTLDSFFMHLKVKLRQLRRVFFLSFFFYHKEALLLIQKTSSIPKKKTPRESHVLGHIPRIATLETNSVATCFWRVKLRQLKWFLWSWRWLTSQPFHLNRAG